MVCGADDRLPVGDTTAFPFSAVCKLRVDFPDGTVGSASGVLVGPRTVLTAGHVVHHETRGGVAERVEVYPGYDHGRLPFGRGCVTAIQGVTGGPDPASVDDDFALLTLDRDLGEDAGWLDLEWRRFHSECEGRAVSLAGYPSDRESGRALYVAVGCVEGADNRCLLYRGSLDTGKGQSGSPVWEVVGGEYRIVGVHQGTVGGGWNRASRVTEKLVAWAAALRTGTTPGPTTFRGQCEDFRLRRWVRDKGAAGDVRAYEFDLLPPERKKPTRLTFRVRGGSAEVIRPDGSRIAFAGRYREENPEAGRYKVLTTAERRRVRLRVKPNGRR
jgi:V8-like Glu-specific endopeptidase